MIVDILTIPAQRRYFEKHANWEIFAKEEIDIYTAKPTQRSMFERWEDDAEVEEPTLADQLMSEEYFPSLGDEPYTEEEWEEAEREVAMDEGMDEWENPEPIETVADWGRAARGEGLGLERIGRCGAWGDDDW